MAFNYKYTRLLAFCQTGLALLTVVFGIVDRAVLSDELESYRWPAIGGVPIWVGIWFFVTGVLGIVASTRKAGTDSPSKAVVGTYLGFSITSTVLAATMLICYAISIIGSVTYGGPCQRDIFSHYPNKDCQIVFGIGSMLLIFAVLMFGVNIWAAVCSCMGLACSCCNCCKPASAQQPHVVYPNAAGGPNAGYVMVQGPGGNPILVPAYGGRVPEFQGGQMTSGQVAAGYQPQLAKAGYQPHEPQAAGLLQQNV